MTPALRLVRLSLLRERDFRSAEVLVTSSLAIPGQEPFALQLGPQRMKAGEVWEPNTILLPPTVHRAVSWSLLVSEIDSSAEQASQQLRQASLNETALGLAASVFAIQEGIVLVAGRAAATLLSRLGRSDELAAGAGWLYPGMPLDPLTVFGPETGPSAEALLEVVV